MRIGRVLLGLVALAMLVAGPALAAEGPLLRFVGASVNPTGDLQTDDTERVPLGDGTTLTAIERTDIEVDSALGFGLDLEYRFNDLFGLDFAIMRSDHDIELSGTETVRITDDATNATLLESTQTLSAQAGVDMTPLLVGTNFHFGSGEKVDLYAGPFVGWVFFDSVAFQGDRIDVKNDFAYGATVGLDVPFGEGGMNFSGAVRYMIASAEPDEPGATSLDVDPWIVLVGLGYRF